MERFIFAAVFVSALAGFFACAYLRAHVRASPMCPNHRPIHTWGQIFFAGALLLNVAFAMGDRAPTPVRHMEDPRAAFGQLVACWGVICLAGMAVGTAFAAHRRARESRFWANGWKQAHGMARLVLCCTLLLTLNGCLANGQLDLSKGLQTSQALTTLYYQRGQAVVDGMKPGPAKDAAQAKLLKSETDAELILAVGQIVVGALPVPTPATQPVPHP